MTSFSEMMMRDAAEKADDRPRLAPDIEAVRLREALAQYGERHNFTPGMILRQKPQASIYVGFGDNDLVIVVEVLTVPIVEHGEHGTPHFMEILDLRVGSIEPNQGGDGTNLCIYHVDSRRFEPAPAEVLGLLEGA